MIKEKVHIDHEAISWMRQTAGIGCQTRMGAVFSGQWDQFGHLLPKVKLVSEPVHLEEVKG